jgi:hypothetical protein
MMILSLNCLDANNTKYIIWFDAAGNVIAMIIVW